LNICKKAIRENLQDVTVHCQKILSSLINKVEVDESSDDDFLIAGVLKVTIIKAKGIPIMDESTGKCDPLVRAYLD
jgi:hypothetical protein